MSRLGLAVAAALWLAQPLPASAGTLSFDPALGSVVDFGQFTLQGGGPLPIQVTATFTPDHPDPTATFQWLVGIQPILSPFGIANQADCSLGTSCRFNISFRPPQTVGSFSSPTFIEVIEHTSAGTVDFAMFDFDLHGAVIPVPAPAAGTGVTSLLMAVGGLLGWRRRRARQLAAD